MHRLNECGILFFIFVIFISSTAIGQHKEKKGLFGGLSENLTINGYIDGYIAYDDDKGPQPRQFSAIAPYRDEFRINLAMIGVH